MTDRLVLLAIASGGIFLLCGCGGDSLGRQPVSGTVTLDGTPLGDGNISFTPLETSTTSGGGKITAGSYALTGDAGLPPGKYKVVIHAAKPGTGGELPEGEMPGEPLAPAEELIPPEWNVNSTQTIEVREGSNPEFNFEIASAK